MCDYSGLNTWEMQLAVRTDYKFRLTNSGDPVAAMAGLDVYWPAYYQIDIRVEPCMDATLAGGKGMMCCTNTGVVNCQDNAIGILAGPDMQIAYLQNAHISTCEGTDFSSDVNCGTYIEIHRSDNGLGTSELTDSVAEVLESIHITSTNGGYQTAYMRTSNLCTGDYALWWVVRTRSGPYVQFQKSFSVAYPSCQ